MHNHGKTPADRVEFARQAAYVTRYHVHRYVGDYTSHEHVCNMQNMYLILCPNPTLTGVKLIQWHDAGEYGPGDMPSPAKSCFGVGEIMNKIERCVRENYGLQVEDPVPQEILWLKSLDITEFFLFCHDQILLGNQFIMPMAVKVRDYIQAKIKAGNFPPELADYFTEINISRPVIDMDEVLEMRE